MQHGATLTAAAILFGFVTGCGSDDAPTHPGQTTPNGSTPAPAALSSTAVGEELTAYCADACKKLVTCKHVTLSGGATIDCKKQCNETVNSVSKKLSGNFLSGLSSCVQNKLCEDFTDADDPAMLVCVNEAALTAAPSEVVTKACQALQAANGRCENRFDLSQCFAQAKLLTDDVVETAMESCANVPCEGDKLRKCIETSIGIANYVSLEQMEGTVKEGDYAAEDRKQESDALQEKVRTRCHYQANFNSDDMDWVCD